MAETIFEVSSLFVRSLAQGVREIGQLERVLATVPRATAESLTAPDGQRWHPGHVPLHVCTALGDLGQIEQAFAVQTQRSLGPVATPLLKVALAISGNSPATAFGRLADILPVIMRGMASRYDASSPTAGVVTITYPESVSLDRFACGGWTGALRYAYFLCGVTGTTRGAASMGRVVKVEASWTIAPK